MWIYYLSPSFFFSMERSMFHERWPVTYPAAYRVERHNGFSRYMSAKTVNFQNWNGHLNRATILKAMQQMAYRTIRYLNVVCYLLPSKKTESQRQGFLGGCCCCWDRREIQLARRDSHSDDRTWGFYPAFSSPASNDILKTSQLD